MKKQLLIYFLILLFLGAGTALVILYGNGYQFSFNNGRPELSGTGLLVATSTPDGAQVFINDHLTTATNNTINLAPGKYDVKIVKDGYFTWEKEVEVDKEVVTKAEALLFPNAPKLESITDTGVTNPIIDPSMTKLAFTISSQSAQKNGIYVLDMGNRSLITFQSGINQIADDTNIPFSTAQISWSPDGSNLLATVSGSLTTTYLLDTSGMNSNPQDVTETLDNLNTTWQKQISEKNSSRLLSLKSALRQFISQNTNILSWSPDETKILYVATQDANLSQVINPPLIGADSTPEVRSVQTGNVYLYDTKEDKNFKISDSLSGMKIMWFPDSLHLIDVDNGKISIEEYDGANNTVIYAGPFIDSAVFPWPTADKVVMLTNFNNNSITPNLYTIDLK